MVGLFNAGGAALKLVPPKDQPLAAAISAAIIGAISGLPSIKHALNGD